MAWRWLRHIKNDNIDYTFAVPYWNFSVENTGVFFHNIGGDYRGGSGPYPEGEAAIEFTANQENIDNLAFQYSTGSVITIPSKVAGGAIQYRIGGYRFPYWFSPTWYKITNYTNQENITSASITTGVPESSGDFTAHNQALYLCCAINDEEAIAFMGFIEQGYRWQYNNPNSYYSNAGQTTIMSVGNGTSYNNPCNVYSLIASSEAGGGGSNPYEGGGTSEPGGGEDQNFDEVSDTIDLPALPIYGATGSGFVTAFCPTVGQINDVADYLITPNVAQVIQGLFVKLSDVIIGLHLLPFVVNASNSKNIEIKNLAFSINTGVTSFYADNQYQRLDMGSVDVLKCWDNCLDYNPYTFVSIYLPFCGYFELDTDEVMGKTLHVVYDIDIITGSCVALIQIDGSVMYQFSGMCSCQIPITSVDFNQAVQSLIGLGASAAAGIKMIKGAATATQEAASRAMAPQKSLTRQLTYENYMEAKMNEQDIKEDVASRLAGASVNAVISGKGNYMHAGAVSSAPGFLACRKPFLIIKRPKQSVPEDYGTMRGFPSNMKATLGDLSGYTEVEDIHLNIPDATVDEIVECERLLKGGVYL